MSGISEDFNASAQRFLKNSDMVELMLTKYSALLTFKTAEPEEKEKLAAQLFETAEAFLKKHAAKDDWTLGPWQLGIATKLLAALAEPETALLLPARAPTVLGDLALAFVEKGETRDRRSFSEWTNYQEYVKAIPELAQQTLKCAKSIKAKTDRRREDVSTSKNFTAPRPFVLKKDDSAPGG